MSTAEHERFHDDVGAYLLGALDEPERDAFERHFDGCRVCQDELARLRVAVEVLPRAVDQYAPPPSLKRALMEQVRAEAAPATRARRRLAERLGLASVLRRPELAMVATSFVLIVGLLSGYAISKLGGGGGGQEVRTTAASVDRARLGDARAALRVPEGGQGAQLDVSGMPQPPPGHVYEVWLQRGGRAEPGPLFSVDREGHGVAAVPGDMDGVQAVLVTRERRGGARAPSEQPVVTART